ncbi:uncharacterized protein LOC130834519 [Hippopotamus amphibius kiboko]|uniref:uncharacterized protein LOC130834519 n=1 Tax=Hippopotamus amphibius kiboko TaxID=575201 RepID=UPI002596E919|nr:uncharacterized protein LOC130834519 [Hippopotamus amphibius kiboko]
MLSSGVPWAQVGGSPCPVRVDTPPSGPVRVRALSLEHPPNPQPPPCGQWSSRDPLSVPPRIPGGHIPPVTRHTHFTPFTTPCRRSDPPKSPSLTGAPLPKRRSPVKLPPSEAPRLPDPLLSGAPALADPPPTGFGERRPRQQWTWQWATVPPAHPASRACPSSEDPKTPPSFGSICTSSQTPQSGHLQFGGFDSSHGAPRSGPTGCPASSSLAVPRAGGDMTVLVHLMATNPAAQRVTRGMAANHEHCVDKSSRSRCGLGARGADA